MIEWAERRGGEREGEHSGLVDQEMGPGVRLRLILDIGIEVEVDGVGSLALALSVGAVS